MACAASIYAIGSASIPMMPGQIRIVVRKSVSPARCTCWHAGDSTTDFPPGSGLDF